MENFIRINLRNNENRHFSFLIMAFIYINCSTLNSCYLKPFHFLCIARSKYFNCFSNKVLFSIHAPRKMSLMQATHFAGYYWHWTNNHFDLRKKMHCDFTNDLTRQHWTQTVFFFFVMFCFPKITQLFVRQNIEKLWKCGMYNVYKINRKLTVKNITIIHHKRWNIILVISFTYKTKLTRLRFQYDCNDFQPTAIGYPGVYASVTINSIYSFYCVFTEYEMLYTTESIATPETVFCTTLFAKPSVFPIYIHLSIYLPH